MVVEKSGAYERVYDIYSRLLKERIVFLSGIIDDNLSTVIVAQLLLLDSESISKPIHVYINTPGGSVTAGLALYDTMQHIKSPVYTFCTGQALSMGALLLCAGTAGKRKILPSSRVMLHQPWGGVEGQASDISIQTKEFQRIKGLITRYFVKHTKKSAQTIKKDIERDLFLSAEKALDYGLVDEILY